MSIPGQFKTYSERKWFKTGSATLFSFSSSLFFLGGRRKRVRNNLLPYKTG
jgi:hypothetical protein